jgi:hypothetical protein
MPNAKYRHELRSGERIVPSGYLSWEPSLKIGDNITIEINRGTLRAIEPIIGSHEKQAIVRPGNAEHPHPTTR